VADVVEGVFDVVGKDRDALVLFNFLDESSITISAPSGLFFREDRRAHLKDLRPGLAPYWKGPGASTWHRLCDVVTAAGFMSLLTERVIAKPTVRGPPSPSNYRTSDRDARSFRSSEPVVRGGVESPTFRFSGGFADPRRSIARR
jgi:hypothetical protein